MAGEGNAARVSGQILSAAGEPCGVLSGAVSLQQLCFIKVVLTAKETDLEGHRQLWRERLMLFLSKVNLPVFAPGNCSAGFPCLECLLLVHLGAQKLIRTPVSSALTSPN